MKEKEWSYYIVNTDVMKAESQTWMLQWLVRAPVKRKTMLRAR